jgi:hypothetical protein
MNRLLTMMEGYSSSSSDSLGNEGLSSAEIAKRIGRPESSVRVKLVELAIRDEIADGAGGQFKYVGSKPTWIYEEGEQLK